MKRFVKENKLLATILSILFSALITYTIISGRWIVSEMYNLKQSDAIAGEVAKQISKDIEALKVDVREIRDGLKEQNEKAEKNRDKVFEILLDIKKQTKENNKK
jgi:hypothetical protein